MGIISVRMTSNALKITMVARRKMAKRLYPSQTILRIVFFHLKNNRL